MTHQKRLPIWMTGRDRAVADALLADGFFYCGYADDFCESPGLEAVGNNWEVGGSYQSPGFDAVCEGALFCKDYSENCDLLTDAEFARLKKLISQAQIDWDTCANAGQLSLQLTTK